MAEIQETEIKEDITETEKRENEGQFVMSDDVVSPTPMGLVLEGGGMRGIYTAGVLDEFLLHGIKPHGIVGVSAGILHAISFVSCQYGRDAKYYAKYRSDKRFMSVESLIRTGNICETEFCYDELTDVLAPVDFDTFEQRAREIPTYSCATNLKTGQAEYLRLTDIRRQRDRDAIRASASMPLVSKIVECDGLELLDGGTADSIPIEFMRESGFVKNICVLTRTEGYRKKPDRMTSLIGRVYREYPEYVEASRDRYLKYNETMERLEEYEASGQVLIIRPSRDLSVKRTERNIEKLKRMYKLGRFDAKNMMEEILAYVKR